MKNSTRWKASWVDRQGRRQAYIFDGSPHRGIARIDFQLMMVGRGELVPGTFALDEVVLSTDEETLVLPMILPGGRTRHG